MGRLNSLSHSLTHSLISGGKYCRSDSPLCPMSEIEISLREGAVVQKTDGKVNCFANVIDLVEQYDAHCHPNTGHKLYRYIRNTSDRMKIVCHLNRSCVSEVNRQCSFFLIAQSKDNGKSCKICKKVCIRHSCMQSAYHNEFEKSGDIVMKESAYQLGKKRKLEDELEAFQEAWEVILNDKYYKNGDDLAMRSIQLESMGLFEASDLKDLGADHVNKFACLLKEIPSTRLKRLLLKKSKSKK